MEKIASNPVASVAVMVFSALTFSDIPKLSPAPPSEKNKGGGNSGEGKTYHKTPSPKTVLDPPTYDTFPPRFVFALLISLEETGTDQANPTF